MNPSPVIAIDGHAASGKGTLARELANRFGYAHLDTGKLYRAVAWSVLKKNYQDIEKGAALEAENLDISLLQEPALAQEHIAAMASKISAIPAVRAVLLQLQQDFAAHPPGDARGAVLDGRDIGTVICPEAPVKIFVTADIEIRAQRRVKELQDQNKDVIYASVLKDMKERDKRDMARPLAPLKPAKDAFLMNTSTMSVDQMVENALSYSLTRIPYERPGGQVLGDTTT